MDQAKTTWRINCMAKRGKTKKSTVKAAKKTKKKTKKITQTKKIKTTKAAPKKRKYTRKKKIVAEEIAEPEKLKDDLEEESSEEESEDEDDFQDEYDEIDLGDDEAIIEAKKAKEEQYIVQMVKDSKFNNSEDAFTFLISKMSNYFDWIAHKFFIDGFDRNDIVQECMIALRMKAVPDFDESKGSFVRFAKLCVKRHIITKLKQMKKKKYKPMNEALSMDRDAETDEDGNVSSIISYIDSGEDNVDDHIANEEYKQFMIDGLNERLTKLEKIVLELYFEGYSYKEIVDIMNSRKKSDRLSYNVKVVDNALERIKRKARTLLSGIEKGKIYPRKNTSGS